MVMAIEGESLKTAAQKPDTELLVANYTQSVERFGKEHVDQQWLKANNEAFSWHPEQGGWDMERLHRGMEPAWVDEKDVIFFWDVPANAEVTTKESTEKTLPNMAASRWTQS